MNTFSKPKHLGVSVNFEFVFFSCATEVDLKTLLPVLILQILIKRLI